MTTALISEIERRVAMIKVIDSTIDRLFDIVPGEPKQRMRRNLVHATIQAALGVQVLHSIPARKLIIDRLKAKGVVLRMNTGSRYFIYIHPKGVPLKDWMDPRYER